MALKVHFKSGPLKGHTLDFDDDKDDIVFGRDPEQCDVVLPMAEREVSREHCALMRVLGRYRLILNGKNPVYLDGRPGHEDEVLDLKTELRLGQDGPLMLVETVTDDRLRSTVVLTDEKPTSPYTALQKLRRNVFANRLLVLGAVVLILCTVGLAFLVGRSMSKKQEEQFQDVEKKLESTRVEISTLSSKERENIAGVLKKISEEDPIRRFRDMVGRVEPSIYLVLLRTGKDAYLPMGTAWVVGKGLVATNAHVAEVFEKLKAGQKLMVRSSALPPRDFEVESVKVHPGYPLFKQTVDNHQPVDPGTGERASFIQACDVALMFVKGAADLGPALELEPFENLTRLKAGEGVAFVGYPIEGVRLNDVARPQPTSQIGHITSLTDVFNGKTLPAKQLLVRHNLPLTGGVSGSPLMNREGKVVAVISAGTFHVVFDPVTGLPQRKPSAVLINFAQRVDLLKELLDGKAEEIQALRTREWVADIVRFKSGRKSRKEILKELTRVFKLHLKSRGVKVKSIERVLKKRGMILKPGLDSGAAFQVDIPRAGYHMITAVADEVKDINIAVLRGTRVIAKDEMRDHFPSVSMRLKNSDKLKILVHLKPMRLPETHFTLVITRAVE